MTDTHTHIYDLQAFTEGPSEALKRAVDAGVGRFVLPNCNEKSVEPLLDLHHRFADCTYIAAGLHPCDAAEDWQAQLRYIFDCMGQEKGLVAIGEVGMDLYWDKSTQERQKKVFAYQIELAQSRSLPLIIHCREALDETLEILNRYRRNVKAVFHSFTRGAEDVKKIRDCGDYYFGINGVVTYKNAPALREALPEIGLDRIVLETDSPYLAPVPHRGRRNESAYVVDVCAKVAEVLDLTPREVEAASDLNATRLFGI